MKFLLLAIFCCNAFAGGFFPLEKEGVVLEGYRLHEYADQCVKAEKAPCYDIDACPLEECDLVEEEVARERWSKPFNPTPCQPEEACKELILKEGFCEPGKHARYHNLSGQWEAYCAFPITPEMVRTGRKLLVRSKEKMAAKVAAMKEREARIQAKKEALQAIRNIDLGKIEDAATKEVLETLIKAVEEP